MNYEKLVKESHALACEKGWWEKGKEKDAEEAIQLVNSEICEASEEARKGTPAVYVLNHEGQPAAIEYLSRESIEVRENGQLMGLLKPEGELIELADAMIRIADWFGWNKRSLDEFITHDFPETLKEIRRRMVLSSPLKAHRRIGFSVLAAGEYSDKHIDHWCYLAAAVLRIEAYAQHKNWDLEMAIYLKHEYNKSRSYRHGGKKY